MLTNIGEPLVLAQARQNLDGLVAPLEQELQQIRGESEVLHRELITRCEQLSKQEQRVARMPGELSRIRSPFAASRQRASALPGAQLVAAAILILVLVVAAGGQRPLLGVQRWDMYSGRGYTQKQELGYRPGGQGFLKPEQWQAMEADIAFAERAGIDFFIFNATAQHCQRQHRSVRDVPRRRPSPNRMAAQPEGRAQDDDITLVVLKAK